MRPYLAVIKDSFREALWSRVLWILLVLITLVLAGLAPLGWKRQLATEVRWEDIRDVRGLAQELQSAGQSTDSTPEKHIWTLLPDEFRTRLDDFVSSNDEEFGSDYRFGQRLVDALNGILDREDFFQSELWQDTALDVEAQKLASKDPAARSEDERKRLNRLALEAALPDHIRWSPPTSIVFTYMVWEFGELGYLDEEQVIQFIGFAIGRLISIVVGVFGVAAAILVTAPIIPNMFDAGSVALLLSKPISRPLLFLSKFVGGCWFVLLNAAYLIVGLWLLVGLRLGVWHKKLLLCIPILLFLFVVYYSVSALAGLIWRNTVMAVLVTVLFWLFCWSVSQAKYFVEIVSVDRNRVVQLLPADDTFLAVQEAGKINEWDAETSDWREVMAGDDTGPGPLLIVGTPLVGPVYDPVRKQLVAIRPSWPQGKLLLGRRENDWTRTETTGAPKGASALLVEPDGSVIIVARRGFFRLAESTPPKGKDLELFGWKIPMPGVDPRFQPAGPDRAVAFSNAAAMALNRDHGELIVYDGGALTVFKANEEGRYHTVRAATLEKVGHRVMMAAGGRTVLLGLGDGRIQVVDRETLHVRKEFKPERSNQPRSVTAAPGGRWFGVLFHNRRLWLVDAQQQSTALARVDGQGDISAVAFDGPDRLLVADRVNRVSGYDLPAAQLQQRFTPPLSKMDYFYRYVLSPLYMASPKPGMMDNSINYLLTDRETINMGGPGNADLHRAQLVTDPWAPVWSSLVFVVVTLGAACGYIWRQDF